MTWNASGKIDSITTTGASSSSTGAVGGDAENGTIDFYYDADGNRILRSGEASATLYVHSMEFTLDKTTGALDSTRTVDLPGGASRVESSGDQAQIQLTDHHGTGTLAFDCQTGDVTRRYSDPYGNNLATATTAADGDPSGSAKSATSAAPSTPPATHTSAPETTTQPPADSSPSTPSPTSPTPNNSTATPTPTTHQSHSPTPPASNGTSPTAPVEAAIGRLRTRRHRQRAAQKMRQGMAGTAVMEMVPGLVIQGVGRTVGRIMDQE
ncbi:hypothetical protein GCM10029992_25440 [Glycomyces albus]